MTDRSLDQETSAILAVVGLLDQANRLLKNYVKPNAAVVDICDDINGITSRLEKYMDEVTP
jgi:hypothetical protein